MDSKEMANFLEENQNYVVELLVETEGRYESQQIRVESLIRMLRKKAEETAK